jgi:hypothetical protein
MKIISLFIIKPWIHENVWLIKNYQLNKFILYFFGFKSHNKFVVKVNSPAKFSKAVYFLMAMPMTTMPMAMVPVVMNRLRHSAAESNYSNYYY